MFPRAPSVPAPVIALIYRPVCSSNPLGGGDNFLSRVFHGLCHDEFQTALLQGHAALLHVCSLQPQHDGQLDVGLACCADDAIGQRVHAQNAAENVDEHGFHVLVAQQDFERMRDLLFVGAAADVKEVGG